ncbi:MAG: ketopantoate reductase family protein, partial [Ruminococcus sp.]|nr:ketopantoate reductase family protein [Ruminococcus sp.]
ARSKRLEELNEKGLLYEENGTVKKANIRIIGEPDGYELFDYVFVTVRYNQIEAALNQLRCNVYAYIIPMVNTLNGYDKFVEIIGRGRLIPCFPGAGGSIENGVLHYMLTPTIIQKTTIGEIDGNIPASIITVQNFFKSAKIPTAISKNMDLWQKSHVALVTALANGIYFDGGDNYTTAENKEALTTISKSLKSNFGKMSAAGIKIEPFKLNIIRFCPVSIMNFVIRRIFKTKFAEVCIASHAKNAKEEMELLDRDFKEFLKSIEK